MQITIVAAADSANGIGCGNRLPWRIPSEMAWFRSTTLTGSHNAVIMGRNTWDSIGRALPGRLNIVLSSCLQAAPNRVVISSLDEAIELCKKSGIDAVWIIGGNKVYTAALKDPRVTTIILSRIHKVYHLCDVKFPDIPEDFVMTHISEPAAEDGWSAEFYSRK